MIENKNYIILDLENTKIDSLLLADLKAYGYKITDMSNLSFDEGATKEEELHETLNQVFHYKGHRKNAVVLVTNKAETVAAAKEMELEAIGYAVAGAEFIANEEIDLRALLINEAELQAIREGAKMPNDGPTTIYVKGKDGKGNAENRTNAFGVVWAFLYPYLIFFFSKQIFMTVFAIFAAFLAGTSDKIDKFVNGFMGAVSEETGILEWTANGESLLNIPTLIVTGLIMYFFMGGKKTLQAAKEEAQELKIKNVATCAALTLVLALGLNFCFAGFDFFKFDTIYLEASKRIYEVSLPIGLILYVVVAPFVEELVFRGIIFNAVRGKVKPMFAAVLSATLFAYGHPGLLQLLYAFIIGFMFAYAYHHTRKLWVPIAMHSVINLVVYVLGKMAVFQENTTLGTIGLICAVFSAGFIYFKKERP